MKKIAKAFFIISFFTLADRILGFVFKIYLSRHMDAGAIGVYHVALSFFFVLLSVVTSGIPLVTSKLTAKYRLTNDFKRESSLSMAAMITSLVLSLSLCALILIFNEAIGRLFTDPRSRVILLLLLPALVFSSIYSSLRGNLWGRQKYLVSSALELSEQAARIAICVILFIIGFDKLKATAVSLSIGCLISAIACVACYFISGARLRNPKGHFKVLIRSSAGVSAARASTAAVNGIIALIVPALLVFSGLTHDEAMYEFGYGVGMALPLIYVPLTIVGSLSYVMIPALSKASEGADLALNLNVRRQIEGAIKSSLVLGALFLPLFLGLGTQIGQLVYKNADAGKFLVRCAWLLIPISIESITSSMLNSLDMEMRGLFNYLIGAFVMLAVFLVFAKRFSMDILSIGMGAGWTVSSALNILIMKKRVKISLSFVFVLVGACLLAIPSTYLSKWLYDVFKFVPDIIKQKDLCEFIRIALAGGIGMLFVIAADFLFGLLKIEYFIYKKNKVDIKDKNVPKTLAKG